MLKVKLISPVTHKLEYYSFFKCTDIYYTTISNWKFKKDGFKIKDNSFDFISKKGMTYRLENGEYKPNFEYMIELIYNENDAYVGSKKEKGKLKSLHITIKPELENSYYGLSKDYGDHKPYTLKKGIGTQIKVTSVYFSFNETQKILYQIFKKFNMDLYWKKQDFDKGTLIQHELHQRYNEKKENNVAKTLNHILLFCGVSDDQYTKLNLNKTESKYKMFSIKTDRWNDMGFKDNDNKYRFALKTYRTRKFDTFNKLNILRHPKLEIYLDEENIKRKEYPKLSDIDLVKDVQHQILGNISIMAKLKDEDFISDLYFDAEKYYHKEIEDKTKVLKKLKQETKMNMHIVKRLSSGADSIRDYLGCLLDHTQASYESLKQYTGFEIDWIKQITYALKETKIIKVLRSSFNQVEFYNNNLAEYSRMHLESINMIEKDHEANRILRKENRIKSRNRVRKKVLSRQFLPKLAIIELVTKGFVEKSNGGFYELINFVYPDEKPENYQDFAVEYG